MGELADDMTNGYSCSWCGVYFEKEHGYPVLCEDCFRDAEKEELTGLSKATEKEL